VNRSKTPPWRPLHRPFAGIKRVAYRNPVHEGIEVAVTDTEQAKKFMAPRHFLGPQRPDFYQWLLFTGGSGTHTVDLVSFPVCRGTLVSLKPGQVQEWDTVDWPPATMLLFHPSFLMPPLPDAGEPPLLALSEEWPVRLSLSPSELGLVEGWFDEIRREIDLADRTPHAVRLLMHLLQVFLIRMGRLVEAAGSKEETEGAAEIYQRFRTALEENFKTVRSVTEYASLVGYSEKSLYRAVLDITGLTPKQAVDDRVSLEAQRLLLHTGWSVKRVAAELHFKEPTNFVKFFRRTTGQTPMQFRDDKTRVPSDEDGGPARRRRGTAPSGPR
jgi:AraC-like DNA-binding protein